MKYKFVDWIKAAGVRALKTCAQTALSLISVGAVMSEIDWGMVASAAVVAGIYSLLTSVAGLPELNGNVEEVNSDGNGE